MGLEPKDEVTNFLAKVAMWIGLMGIGIIGKIAFDSRNSMLSSREIILKSILSVVMGTMSGLACEALGHESWEKLVIPICTLLGESLLVYVMIKWKVVIEKFLPWLKDKKTP
jgi:hypothetical protein